MGCLGAILFGVLIYAVLCLIISGIRSILSKKALRNRTSKKHSGNGSLKHLTHSIGFCGYGSTTVSDADIFAILTNEWLVKSKSLQRAKGRRPVLAERNQEKVVKLTGEEPRL